MQDPISTERDQALGESEEFLELQERISRVASIDRSVILIGERGTGKELAAARLHLLSARWNKPYVTLNCSSLAPSLIESELFGHEAGAFTGANRQRLGRFELADGGSLFLDEVADIPRTAQEKILRVVEYGRFERVGGSTTIATDVRLIAATSADLRRLAAEGTFRRDLLDRLSFEVITLPPLRARGGDILLLAKHFARRMAAELGLEFQPQLSPAAQRALLEHDWPGNVRELKNVVERMVYRVQGPVIDEIVLDPFESPYTPAGARGSPRPPASGPRVPTQAPPGARASAAAQSRALPSTPERTRPAPARSDDLERLPLTEAVDEFRIRLMKQALKEARFSQRIAARKLGLTYHQFRGYFRKHEERFRDSE